MYDKIRENTFLSRDAKLLSLDLMIQKVYMWYNIRSRVGKANKQTHTRVNIQESYYFGGEGIGGDE